MRTPSTGEAADTPGTSTEDVPGGRQPGAEASLGRSRRYSSTSMTLLRITGVRVAAKGWHEEFWGAMEPFCVLIMVM